MNYPQNAPIGAYPVPPQTAQPSRPPMPPSNAGWAVAAIVFFWPVAFAAMNHALNVYPRWAAGDFVGAQHASARAKKLGQIALVVVVVVLVAYIAVIGAAIAAGSSQHY